MDRLDCILKPRSIAIIGASSDENRVGGRPLRHLRRSQFAGKIFPVNVSRDLVQGIKAYRSIGDVEDRIDCAIVAVPAADAVGAVRECAERGVGAVVLFTAGFAELGAAGCLAQDELTATARASGMRILGPNCMGAYNAGTGAYATFASTFVSGYDDLHNVALASQSGGIGSHLVTIAQNRGLIFGNFVTTGNECDVEIGEVIAKFADDPSVKAIAAYIEGVRSSESFIRALETAKRNHKPVIVLKVGQSEKGATIASSHTASLAGFDAGYDAVFRHYGVYRARTIDEMLDVTYAASRGRFPKRNQAVAMSLSGGAAVQIADLSAEIGLELKPFPVAVQQRITEIAPYASTNNPADLTATVVNNPAMFEACLDLLCSECDCEMVLAFVTVALASPGLSEPLFAAVQRVRQRHPNTILAICGIAPPELVRKYEELGCLVFEEMSRAVTALKALADFTTGFSRVSHPISIDTDLPKLRPEQQLNEVEAKAILRQIGIETPQEVFVHGPLAVSACAAEIGFPVAVKLVSADIPHKTEVGGVVLGVNSLDEISRAINQITNSVQELSPHSKLDGFLLSSMAPKGVECIIGITNDPKFGPMVMFGLGGVAVEIFKDVVYRLAPVSKEGALEMIRSIRSFDLLAGHRGGKGADLERLSEAIAALSQLAARNSDCISTIEVNPILALPAGKGVVALDALISTRSDINSHP